MSLLDLDAAKAHLNITGDSQDDEVQAFVDAAESRLVELVGPLEPARRTERITGGRVLILKRAPAASLTSVTDAFGTALDVADLHLEQGPGLVTYSDGRGFGSRWYDVVYTEGRGDAPAHLLLAVKELLRHLWKTQRGQMRPDAEFDPSATYALPKRVLELIANDVNTSLA